MPVLLMPSTNTKPEPKGYLCAEDCSFNPHATRHFAANDKQGYEILCRYFLRPQTANERLQQDGAPRVTIVANISFQAPKRIRNQRSKKKSQNFYPIQNRNPQKKGTDSRNIYIPWNKLLRRTFGSEVVCNECGGKLRLIALVKKDETISTILTAQPMPTGLPKIASDQSPVGEGEEAEFGEGGVSEEWVD